MAHSTRGIQLICCLRSAEETIDSDRQKHPSSVDRWGGCNILWVSKLTRNLFNVSNTPVAGFVPWSAISIQTHFATPWGETMCITNKKSVCVKRYYCESLTNKIPGFCDTGHVVVCLCVCLCVYVCFACAVKGDDSSLCRVKQWESALRCRYIIIEDRCNKRET